MKTMLTVAREWLATEQQRLAASGETVHTGHPAHIVEWLLEEVRLRTLTDAEREAIKEAAKAYADNDGDDSCAGIAAALFGLLERCTR